MPVGPIKIKVKLNDNRDPAEFDLSIEVFPKPPIIIPPEPAKTEPVKEEEPKEEEAEKEEEKEEEEPEEEPKEETNKEDSKEAAAGAEQTETVSIGGVSFDWTPPKKKVRNDKKKIEPPRIRRFDISPVGLMTIEFSKPILIPDIFKKILDHYEKLEKQKETEQG